MMHTNDSNEQPNTAVASRDDYASSQRYEMRNLWRMRWFFAIIIALGFLASVAAGIIAFLITRNSYTLAIISAPTVLIRVVANHLLPMDNSRYRLAAMKIRAKTNKINREKSN